MNRFELYHFGGSSRTDGVGEKHGFCIRGLGGEVTSLAWKGLARKALGLKGWHWLTRIVGGAEF